MTRLRLCSFTAYFVLLVTVPALAQTDTTKSDAKTEKTAGSMECPDPEAKVACHSFQELLAAQDKDLLYTLKGRLKDMSGQVFICFRPREDVFFLLWYWEPEEWQWKKEDKSALFTAFGTTELLRFKNGIFDHGGESAWASGKWRSTDKALGNARFASEDFASEGGSKGEIEIDGGTVTVSHSFEKMAGGGAQYSFKLQKSTGRFTETFTAPKTPEHHVVGRCLKWNPNSR